MTEPRRQPVELDDLDAVYRKAKQRIATALSLEAQREQTGEMTPTPRTLILRALHDMVRDMEWWLDEHGMRDHPLTTPERAAELQRLFDFEGDDDGRANAGF